MPHDHDGHSHHAHSHPGHHHHAPGAGHNHAGPDHLHSHLHGNGPEERLADLQRLAASFIDGFRAATDKTSYLRLSGIPFHREGEDGLTMHLVDARIDSTWQIGTASPAFASRELAYLPFPGEMVAARENMVFVYVSLTARADVDLQTLLGDRLDPS